ncbi:DUF4240 domain-containing protein [Streptomyces sp. NPDC127069]|uniref:DUF4240 domain-containing protein n=1 Tax=Streptomyces sp. NPDC127069 TaxID=3347128 RepID=UPI00365DFEB8
MHRLQRRTGPPPGARIEDCRPSTSVPERVGLAAALTARLTSGPVSDVVGFAEQLSWAVYRLDRKEHGNGLSGDAFLHTRAAVVAAGRDEYESVLRDPQQFRPGPTAHQQPRRPPAPRGEAPYRSSGESAHPAE